MFLIRNFFYKDPAYISGKRKNWFEIKGGRRFLLFGNYMLNYDQGAQLRALVLTPDTQTYGEIRDVTFFANIFDDINGGTANFGSQGSGNFNNLGSSRIEFMHNDVRNCSGSTTVNKFTLFGAADAVHNHYDDVRVHHNAFDHQHSWVGDFDGLVQMLNFRLNDNVYKRAVVFGPIRSSIVASNETALNTHCGPNNWQCRKNVGITGSPSLGSLTSAPHSNALTTSANLFVDAANNNWIIKSAAQGASPSYKGTATDGIDPGPDWGLLSVTTANVKSSGY